MRWGYTNGYRVYEAGMNDDNQWMAMGGVESGRLRLRARPSSQTRQRQLQGRRCLNVVQWLSTGSVTSSVGFTPLTVLALLDSYPDGLDVQPGPTPANSFTTAWTPGMLRLSPEAMAFHPLDGLALTSNPGVLICKLVDGLALFDASEALGLDLLRHLFPTKTSTQKLRLSQQQRLVVSRPHCPDLEDAPNHHAASTRHPL
ncbi:hypothetical protein BDK51DRAFT_51598 [Blyttiomyces helicus]|uniref:Uncharacterized protein n=1 Tax=Blyttiomyces helicus TaxID=388810 RepID=A0A4P9WGU7_9FUNG|nr:hypothetical protein BDK51DRAFT_51598 [Blyttiomyces helicus]|eukprot:RKO92029.1 hypothetical protein BDK51DRAFT_51598 [Blyttiomyces helicus]